MLPNLLGMSLRRLAIATLGWNILTILLGALVRATGSGAGCGRSWPTCQGELVPPMAGATSVEFTHRAASGIALVLVAVLALVIWRRRPAGHPARRGAVVSVLAILGEALIGALIVLFEWVGTNVSVARAISVPLHLVNTLLLLGALTFTLRSLDGERYERPAALYWWVAAGLVLVAATGAVTALADTLLPSSSVGSSLESAIRTGEHFLTRLRVAHPVVAVVVGLTAASVAGRQRPISKAASIIFSLVALQLVVGSLNVWLKAPIALQLFHLLVADLLWIAWVWLSLDVSRSAAAADSSVAAAH